MSRGGFEKKIGKRNDRRVYLQRPSVLLDSAGEWGILPARRLHVGVWAPLRNEEVKTKDRQRG
jgi:hypothetical protein